MKTRLLVATLIWLAGCAGVANPTSIPAGAAYTPTTRPTATSTSRPQIATGSLGASKYVIAVPPKWNGDLLLLAHGYRRPEAPLTAGDLDLSTPPFKDLVADGWMIGAASYRRNGIIIRDGAEDIELFRQHVAAQYGQPRRTFLIGSSMGGAVGAMLAETRGVNYHGMLLIGAALGLQDPDNPYRLTYRPQAPLLFLSNRNEVNGPAIYVKRAAGTPKPAAVWVVKREGHCNVSGLEMLAAINALLECDRTGKLEGDRDVTVPIPSKPSVARVQDGRAYAKILRVSGEYGNLNTALVPADLARLGIAQGSYFLLGRGDKTVRVLLGYQYGDVAQGEWVAFVTANGGVLIARNFANAAAELGCKAGDEIYIAPVQNR